jgi:hypothetical protein
MTMDPLLANLLDLLRELDTRGIPLTVGGGFGLYLKRGHLERTGERTLFAELPGVRATNDIDLFLRAEVLADLARTKEVAGAIARLGYAPVEEAKYLQWKRPVVVGSVEQDVKIDVLVGPLGKYRSSLKVSEPRVRPKGDIKFHAHTVEEAVHLEDRPVEMLVEGRTSDGASYRGTVFVPEAFPYLMMKLHAFGDRKSDANKNLGRHHALDAYSIVGMMTEAEYERAKTFAAADREDEHVRRACSIVSEDFSNGSAIGILRLREHQLYRADFRLDDFVAVMTEIFGGG